MHHDRLATPRLPALDDVNVPFTPNLSGPISHEHVPAEQGRPSARPDPFGRDAASRVDARGASADRAFAAGGSITTARPCGRRERRDMFEVTINRSRRTITFRASGAISIAELTQI